MIYSYIEDEMLLLMTVDETTDTIAVCERSANQTNEITFFTVSPETYDILYSQSLWWIRNRRTGSASWTLLQSECYYDL